MSEHWHVTRHSDDDDPYVTSDLYAALGYASEELDLMAEYEHSGIGTLGDAGMWEEAYRCWQRCEQYNALHLQALNIVTQHEVAPEHRAPLYQGDDWEGRLRESALRVAASVGEGSPMAIWDCADGACTCPCCGRDGYFRGSEWGICSDCVDAGDHEQVAARGLDPAYPYCAATGES